jgi:hypothetical protein
MGQVHVSFLNVGNSRFIEPGDDSIVVYKNLLIPILGYAAPSVFRSRAVSYPKMIQKGEFSRALTLGILLTAHLSLSRSPLILQTNNLGRI